MKILLMGLPGSGKTTLAKQLKIQLEKTGHQVEWYNADTIREKHNDWDFSPAGRTRQAERMRQLADSSADLVICDFVAPTEQLRNVFSADYTVWVDTIESSRFDDTNRVFEEPGEFNLRVSTQDSERWANTITQEILFYLRKK